MELATSTVKAELTATATPKRKRLHSKVKQEASAAVSVVATEKEPSAKRQLRPQAAAAPPAAPAAVEDEEERADRARALAAVARSEANDAVIRQEQAILETSPMPPHKVLMRGDGNCLFRALSFAAHGTQQRFHYYRTMAVMRVRNNPGDFEEFLDGDETLNAWADRLSRDMVFGDHLCLKALAEVVSRPIVVWRQRLLNTDLPQSAKVTVFVPDGYTNEEPIHVLLEETALAPQGAWCGFADYEGHYNVLQAAAAPASAAGASESSPDEDDSQGIRPSQGKRQIGRAHV